MMKYFGVLLLISVCACTKKPENEIKLAPIKKSIPVNKDGLRPEETESKEGGSEETKPELEPHKNPVTPEKQIPVDLPLIQNQGKPDEKIRKSELPKAGDIPDLPQMDGFENKNSPNDVRVAPTRKPDEPIKFPDDKEFKGLGDM